MTVLYKPFILCVIALLAGCASVERKTDADIGSTTVVMAAETPAPVTRSYRRDTGESYLNVNASNDNKPNSGQLLGSFDTQFSPKQTDRNHNITRASDLINNQVIQPGEVFSYNETVGPTSKKNGYKKGTIFIKGEKSKGYGGGVCQVSSTLYNAAANAGMTILERHDHSRPVDYVELGNDAATSYGGIDLKFQNDKPFPVIIKSHTTEDTVSISINVV